MVYLAFERSKRIIFFTFWNQKENDFNQNLLYYSQERKHQMIKCKLQIKDGNVKICKEMCWKFVSGEFISSNKELIFRSYINFFEI